MNNISKNIQYEPNNGFAQYFKDVIKSIDNGDWSRWETLLASDCKVMDKAREGIKNYD